MFLSGPKIRHTGISSVREPHYVIMLVHGTFAPGAKWTQPGSRLRETLQARLGGEKQVHFEVFNWSGFLGTRFNNGHRYRLRAGERLASALTRNMISYPDSQHFVIAHSHGGNVALYALRETLLHGELKGVVCIGTPFISCVPRDVESTLRGYPHAVWFVVFFATILPIFGLVAAGLLVGTLKLLEYLHVPSNIVGWAGQIPFWGLIYPFYRYYPVRYGRLLGEYVIPSLVRWAAKAQETMLARLRLPDLPEQPILCVRAAGDEAKRHLELVRGVADTVYWVWNSRVYLGIALALSVVAFLWPTLLPQWWQERYRGTLDLIQWSFATGIGAAIIISLAHFVALAIFPRLVRGHGGGFGQESLLDNMLLQISARPTPEGIDVVEREYNLEACGLRHSGLYEDERVISDIAHWIRSSHADSEPSEPASEIGRPAFVAAYGSSLNS